MKSIKIRILLSFLIVVALCSTLIGIIVFRNTKAQLMASTKSNLEYVSKSIAEIFHDMNEREYKMLHTIASVPIIKEKDADIWDKYKTVREVAVEDKTYIDVTILTKDGYAPATTEGGQMISFKERAYYQVPMTGKNYVTDPFVNKVTKKMAIFYAVPVHSKEGEIINVVFSVLDGYRMCDIVAGMLVGKSNHPVAINKKTGQVVAAADKTWLDNNTNIKDLTSFSVEELFGGDIIKKQSGMGYFSRGRSKMIAFFHSVPDTDWVTLAAMPVADFQGGINATMKIIALLFLLMFVVMAVLCGGVIGISLRPLTTAKNSVAQIATGNADLTQRLPISSHDEVGDMLSSINAFIQKLQEIVKEIALSKNDLSAFGEKLGLMVKENTDFVNKMVESIKVVETELDSQSQKVSSAVNATNSISSAVETLKAVLETQEEGAQTASSAVTQMIGNIDSVSHLTQKMANEFSSLQTNVSSGIESENELNTQIKQIEEQSKMLDEANVAISSIAEQTNLLAMNAAIEAAHAGEAGKGFAVVADEIRKLSENSSEQSKTIKEQLTSILEAIAGAVDTSVNSNKVFTNVSAKLKETDILVQEIRQAMKEQTQGSKQIGDAIGNMNEATKQVLTSSVALDDSKNKITQDVKDIEKSSVAVKDSLSGIKDGVKKIEEGDDSVMGIASQINSFIYRINNQVEQFKV